MKKRAGAAVSECGVGGRRAFAAGRRRALSLGLSLSLALSLSGCATVPGPKDTQVDFTVESVRTEALDQHRYRFSVVLSAFNRGSRTLEPLSASCALFLGGDPAGESLRDEPARIPSGEKADFRFEFDADLRELGGAFPGPKDRDDLPWEIRAELRAPDGEDGVLLGAARSEGSCPLVREPELVIRTIVLVKHELINVLLELVLEVRNPNAFPVEFSSASYQFYGEGARWANGSARKAVMIPARGSAEVRLPIVLNFTETGRNLFDLVARLKVVRYRLAGEARVATPVPFLPEFRMSYDKSGATRVERSLPAER